jgi:hypothetical protein
MEKLLVDLWGASISVEGDVWAIAAAIIIVGIVAGAACLDINPIGRNVGHKKHGDRSSSVSS